MAGATKTGQAASPGGILLGLGLGGFFDGIVLHQILQWHHRASDVTDTTTVSGLRLNVLLDGLFHAATYIFTVVGVALLWRTWRTPDVPASGRTLFGSAILGWGLFNFIEGLIDHQLLGIHHVWPDGPGSVILWDLAFLAWGLLFIIGGYNIIRGDDAFAAPHEQSQPEAGPDHVG